MAETTRIRPKITRPFSFRIDKWNRIQIAYKSSLFLEKMCLNQIWIDLEGKRDS